jgi:hypothetical protein
MRLMNELWEGRKEILIDCGHTLGMGILYVLSALFALAILAVMAACTYEHFSQRKNSYKPSRDPNWTPVQGVPQEGHWTSGMFG